MIEQGYPEAKLLHQSSLMKYVFTEGFQVDVRRTATLHKNLSSGLIYGHSANQIMTTTINAVIPDERHDFITTMVDSSGTTHSIKSYKEHLELEGYQCVGVWVHGNAPSDASSGSTTVILGDLVDYENDSLKGIDDGLVLVDIMHPMKPLQFFKGRNNSFEMLVAK